MNLYLGLDIGGTKCAAVIGDETGTIQDRIAWPSEAQRGPDAMLADLIHHAKFLQSKCCVRAAGAAIGGPVDSTTGIVYSPPNLPGWDGFPLKQKLHDALNLPIAVEHDGSACALAEYRWGLGSGAQRLAYLTCGTGLGVGLVFAGKIYRGSGGNAPDFGHITYRQDGPEAYGKRGSLESFASGSGIARLATWRFPNRWSEGQIDTPGIAALAKAGDRDAKEIIDINARAVGDACAILADLLYTDVILLGNLARYLGEDWLTTVRNQFDAAAHPRARSICRIAPAALGEKLQDCSSYVSAIDLA